LGLLLMVIFLAQGAQDAHSSAPKWPQLVYLAGSMYLLDDCPRAVLHGQEDVRARARARARHEQRCVIMQQARLLEFLDPWLSNLDLGRAPRAAGTRLCLVGHEHGK
jgi:hypothetical protein